MALSPEARYEGGERASWQRGQKEERISLELQKGEGGEPGSEVPGVPPSMELVQRGQTHRSCSGQRRVCTYRG